MKQPIFPAAFLVAETNVNVDEVNEALKYAGVKSKWSSDAFTDAAYLTEFAGKSCYMSFDKSVNKNLTKTGGRTNEEYIAKGILANGHGSVLEHATVTFYLVNVSRVVTHELVRHRAGTAFSQTSGRYVRSNDVNMYVPIDIAVNSKATEIFLRAALQMEENASDMAKALNIDEQPFDVKKRMTSAIRRIIGVGRVNNILVTANHRAWRHMIAMRTDPHAEEEIRVVFADISQQLRYKFPALYSDAVISLERGIEVTTFANGKV